MKRSNFINKVFQHGEHKISIYTSLSDMLGGGVVDGGYPTLITKLDRGAQPCCYTHEDGRC